MSRGTRLAPAGYAALAVVGLVGTWWFSLWFDADDGQGHLAAWFLTSFTTIVFSNLLFLAVRDCRTADRVAPQAVAVATAS